MPTKTMLTIRRTGTLLVLGLALCWAWSDAVARTPQQQRIMDEHISAQQTLAEQLTHLSTVCEAQGFQEEADRLRQLQVPFARLTLDVDALPETVGADIPEHLPDAERLWRIELRELQRSYAEVLAGLSRRAIGATLPSYGFQLLREAALHDPDHEIARRALGYIRHEGRWTTPYAARMLSKGLVWDDRFGWMLEDHIPRYEAGERFFRGQWMTAERESLLRGQMANGWVIESDHFIVRTNYSQTRAVELSVALEEFHRYFVREFSDLFNTPQQMQQLFGSGRPRGPPTGGRHEVWYFHAEDEFERFITAKQPALRGVNGLYLPSDRRTYFYANPDDPQRNLETMFHEVTHQILSESGRTTFAIAEDRDFWIVEGFACYLESFDSSAPGRPIVGNPRHSRIYWARERVVTEDWFIPIAEFTSFGAREFQTGGDFSTMQKYYSQATGLTHFLLHHDGGRYRDGCIRYLGQLYSPDKRIRLNAHDLSYILGVPYTELDKQYREYISALPTSAAR